MKFSGLGSRPSVNDKGLHVSAKPNEDVSGRHLAQAKKAVKLKNRFSKALQARLMAKFSCFPHASAVECPLREPTWTGRGEA